jgi:hypothetical protein
MCGQRHHHHHHHNHHHGHATPPTTRIPADDLRASDAERESVIADLRAHAGEGRLSVEELDERIGRAYAATSRRELAALMEDLPRIRRPRSRRDERAEFAEHLRSYLAVMALLVAIWALTDLGGYFWPIWPALGWGIAIVLHASSLRGKPRRSTTAT